MYNDFLAYLLKVIRQKEKLTQKEMGKILDKSEISVRKYESGLNNIPVINFYILFMRFNYTLDIILSLFNEIENKFDYHVTQKDFNKFLKDLEKYNIKLDRIDNYMSEINLDDVMKSINNGTDKLIEFLNIKIIDIKGVNCEIFQLKINEKKIIIHRNNFFKLLEILKNNLVNDFNNFIDLLKDSNETDKPQNK